MIDKTFHHSDPETTIIVTANHGTDNSRQGDRHRACINASNVDADARLRTRASAVFLETTEKTQYSNENKTNHQRRDMGGNFNQRLHHGMRAVARTRMRH